jgi:hypothetical protein
MKTVAIASTILVCLSLVGCATAPGYLGKNEVSASPLLMSKRLQYRGFSILRPEHSAWFVRVSEQIPPHATIRCRLPGRTHTAFVSVDLTSVPRNAASQADFAEMCRQDHFDDTNRFAVVSYEQHLSTIQGQWAIEFEMTVRDSGAPNAGGKTLIMRESGYVVNQPTFPNGAVRIMYSERGLPEELDAKVEAAGKEVMKGVRLESAPGTPLRS